MGYEVIARHRPAGTFTVGKDARIARQVSIDTSADVSVGAKAVICEGALILTHDHFDAGEPRLVRIPKVIGAGAFIGARSIILASCTHVGAGAVIGAGSVVTHDVPAGERWAGNPARPL